MNRSEEIHLEYGHKTGKHKRSRGVNFYSGWGEGPAWLKKNAVFVNEIYQCIEAHLLISYSEFVNKMEKNTNSV